ncbi:hypothetical protein ACOSQ4_017607 [Xanthoceras sorbifolium]
MAATVNTNDTNQTNTSFYSPYFLHHSDNPGTVLVSQPLIGNENYSTWSHAMLMALSAKNKIAFVDGTLPKPSDKKDSNYIPWVRCNDMLLSWLLNSLSKDIATSVIYMGSIQEVWNDLKDRFSQTNAPRIFQIQQAISSLTQDNLPVGTYFTKLKGYWDEISTYQPIPTCSCGAIKSLIDFQHQEKVMQFLMGLNESYTSVRGQILLMDPLPSINKVFALVVQEERQRDISTTVPLLNEAAALLATNDSNVSFQKRENFGNLKKNSFRERPNCHSVDRCYVLHGYPPGHKFYKGGKQGTNKNDKQGLANHVTTSNDKHSHPPFQTGMPFTPDQCRQLLALLDSSSSQAMAHQVGISQTTLSGPIYEDDDWSG